MIAEDLSQPRYHLRAKVCLVRSKQAYYAVHSACPIATDEKSLYCFDHGLHVAIAVSLQSDQYSQQLLPDSQEAAGCRYLIVLLFGQPFLSQLHLDLLGPGGDGELSALIEPFWTQVGKQ